MIILNNYNDNNLKAMIIDDEMKMINNIAEYIKLIDGMEIVYTTTNAKEGLAMLKKMEIDVLFLDIEMPVMSGMVFLAQLKLIAQTRPAIANLEIVICTGFDNYAVKSYDYKVADYLVKPIPFERFTDAVAEVRSRLSLKGLNRISTESDGFFIYSNRGTVIRKLLFKEILYLEAKEQKTWLWLNRTEYYEIDNVLKSNLLLFPATYFVRVHRSYAISLIHFDHIEDKKIYLKGTDVAISMGEKGKYTVFEEWLEWGVVKGKKECLVMLQRKGKTEEAIPGKKA